MVYTQDLSTHDDKTIFIKILVKLQNYGVHARVRPLASTKV